MNLVGKILTGIIALFSIVFMTLVMAVYATHQNWKKVAKEVETKLNEETTKNKALQDQLEKLKNDYAAERQQLLDAKKSADTEVDLVTKERDKLKAEHEDLEKQKSQAVTALATLSDRAKGLQAEVAALRDDVRKAEQDRDAKFSEVVKKTDELHGLANTLASLNRAKTTLTDELTRAMQVLNKFGLKPAPELYAGQPPHPVFGKVLANPGTGLIEISLGSDDGLAKGHRLEVYRISANESTYLGRVEIVSAVPERSVAKIIPEFQKGVIQKGDDVASQLQFSGVAAAK
ncbi:MAG: hypothetical protein NUV77_25000 [Thermoguttaceae bacterium]|jgi:septal ring factor EnvC (AmiA/AmiB activator)|nr:hypothetical protein [Thermoguttaceae bacterium]